MEDSAMTDSKSKPAKSSSLTDLVVFGATRRDLGGTGLRGTPVVVQCVGSDAQRQKADTADSFRL